MHAMARQIPSIPLDDTPGEVAVLRLVITQLEERIEALEIRGSLVERKESIDADRLSARLVALESLSTKA
jgi:hypothetical protein